MIRACLLRVFGSLRPHSSPRDVLSFAAWGTALRDLQDRLEADAGFREALHDILPSLVVRASRRRRRLLGQVIGDSLPSSDGDLEPAGEDAWFLLWSLLVVRFVGSPAFLGLNDDQAPDALLAGVDVLMHGLDERERQVVARILQGQSAEHIDQQMSARGPEAEAAVQRVYAAWFGGEPALSGRSASLAAACQLN
jgi:hypothetical protein